VRRRKRTFQSWSGSHDQIERIFSQLLLLFRLMLCVAFPGPSPRQVSPLHELSVVHRPEGAEVVLEADETFMQGQVCTDGILNEGERERVAKKGRG